MKTKEEIQSEAEWRFTDGHGATDQYCVKMFVSACEWMQESIPQEWIPVEEETAREPIQDALYATGRFTKDECDVLSDGILRYINDANLVFVPQPYNPTKS